MQPTPTTAAAPAPALPPVAPWWAAPIRVRDPDAFMTARERFGDLFARRMGRTRVVVLDPASATARRAAAS